MSDRKRENATLTVGQFGRLAQLSRKALRLYDARGLLRPARVDSRNGYRYYDRAQVAVARRIKLLRMMDMPLETIVGVLAIWETNPVEAQRQVRAYIHTLKEKYDLARTAQRLLDEDFSAHKEIEMSFTFTMGEVPAQNILSFRRRIKVPAFHEWIQPALNGLWAHIESSGAAVSGAPICLYFGPVNEKDDGPVEIAVPFTGVVMPKGEMMVRALPAHHTLQVRTYGEYNEYPKLLEMWDAIGQKVHGESYESNWDGGLTTYEIWHADMTMTICWPVRAKES